MGSLPQLWTWSRVLLMNSSPKSMEMFVELQGALFDLFSTDGTMTAQQFEVAQTLIVPMPAQEKFDQIWNLLDTDGDGKITQDEAVTFLGKVFDCGVAVAVGCIRMYKALIAALLCKVATALIDSAGGDGLTMEQLMQFAEQGPPAIMGALMAAS